jgi:hypothetical protein
LFVIGSVPLTASDLDTRICSAINSIVVDYENAFDKVNRNKLIEILKEVIYSVN